MTPPNRLIELLRSGPEFDYWGHDPSIEESTLYPAALPSELPMEIPLPEDATLVGSAIPYGREEIEIVLETSVEPEEFVERYDRQLQEAGWELLEWLHDVSGFLPRTRPWLGSLYFDAETEHSVSVRVYRRTGRPHHVYLSLGPSYDPKSTLESDERSAQLTPPLVAPSNGVLTRTGGGGGLDEARSTTTIRADLDLSALHRHYAGQLESRGWVRESTQETSGAISSAWRLPFDGLSAWGELRVVRTKEPEVYVLELEGRVIWQKGGTREDQDVEMCLRLLRLYREGRRVALLSSAARREAKWLEDLTAEQMMLARSLLAGSEDEDAKREQIRRIGAEHARAVLQDVL